MTGQAGTVYLLHFDRPYRHARQSVRWARNVKRRLAEHEAGHGARLLAVVHAAGIGWQLARMWPGGRARERQIKRQGGHARKCPLCGVTPRSLPRNADGSLSRSRDHRRAEGRGRGDDRRASSPSTPRCAAARSPASCPARSNAARWPMTRGRSGPPGRSRIQSREESHDHP